MIKTSVILFILFYLTSANAAQTVDKLNSNQLRLPKETISKALSIDANGQVKSSATSSVELGYLSGTSSNVQGQINDKANDSDAVHLTGDESISGVKTLTGKLVTSSTVNASIPCPVMTQTQRDAIATPVTGDCVFNSNTSLSNIYDGSIWKAMGGSGGGIGLWVTSNGYAVDDVVIESNNIYICLTAHTSGTFATDLASLYWLRLSTDVTGATGLLPLATGGTNKSITASNGSIIYSDSDSLELLSPGTSGQILQTNGAAVPTFVNKSISGKAQNKSSVISEEIQFPNNLLTETGTNKYLSESGNKNILDNPSFEHSTFSTSWTNSAGTFTQELISVIDGKASAKLVLSSQSFSLSQSSTLYASQFADGVQGLAMVRIKSGIALKVCSIQAGTVSSTNCVTTNTDSKWGLYKVPFILGATSNGISISSNGTLVTGAVYIDDAFVGAVDLKQDINNVGPWTSYTPAFLGLGSYSGASGKWRQVGDSIEVNVSCTTGTTTAATASISLPNSYTIDTGKVNIINTTSNPGVSVGKFNTSQGTAGMMGDIVLAPSTSVALVYLGERDGTAASHLTPALGNATVSSSVVFSAFFRIPILQLAGSSSVYSSNNADTDWASCGHTTSDFTGFGTVTAIQTQCKRQGSDLLMKGKVTAGIPTAVEARVSLPLWNGSQLVSAGGSIIPSLQIAGDSADQVVATTYFRTNTLIEPSVSYVTFGVQTSTQNAMTKATGTSVLGNSVPFSFNARIPINGWENSNIIIGSFNGLQSCTDTLACTDTFSAAVSSAGVVSKENANWLNGNCSVSATSTYTCNFNSSIFTVAPNCVFISNSGSNINLFQNIATTASSVQPRSQNNSNVDIAQGFDIICQKQGADYIGKTAMAVASDQNVRSIGSTGVDIQSVYFGSGASCALVCSSSPCTICNQVGSKITSISRSGIGTYRVNGIDGLKYNCTGSGTTNGYIGIAHIRTNSTSSYAELQTGNLSGSNADSGYNSLSCTGIP